MVFRNSVKYVEALALFLCFIGKRRNPSFSIFDQKKKIFFCVYNRDGSTRTHFTSFIKIWKQYIVTCDRLVRKKKLTENVKT